MRKILAIVAVLVGFAPAVVNACPSYMVLTCKARQEGTTILGEAPKPAWRNRAVRIYTNTPDDVDALRWKGRIEENTRTGTYRVYDEEGDLRLNFDLWVPLEYAK